MRRAVLLLVFCVPRQGVPIISSWASSLSHHPDAVDRGTCLERKLLQTDGQAGKGLVTGTGLCDDGEAGGRAGVVARGNLDAGDGGGFV